MGKRDLPTIDGMRQMEAAVILAKAGERNDALYRLRRRKHEALQAFVRQVRRIKRLHKFEGETK